MEVLHVVLLAALVAWAQGRARTMTLYITHTFAVMSSVLTLCVLTAHSQVLRLSW